MPSFIVKGKRGNVKVDIPSEIDERTRKLIISTLEQSLESDYEKQSLLEITRLMGDVSSVVKHLKKDKLYDKITESALRQLVGIYLQRGVHLGKHFEREPEHVLAAIKL